VTSPCDGTLQYGVNLYPGNGESTAQEQAFYRTPFPAVPNAGAVCTSMSVTQWANTTSAVCGQTVTYSLAVSNLGPNGATGGVLTEAVPPGITVLNPGTGTVSGSSISWNIASPLPANTAVTLTWTGTVQSYVGT